MSAFLDWFNTNTAVVGTVSALVGYWFGFRSNLWLERRREWNGVAMRVRADMLNSRDRGTWFTISTSDADLLARRARALKRRRITSLLIRYGEVRCSHQQDSWGQPTHTPEQHAEAKSIRDQLLKLVTLR